jgi:hypothetical protein
MALTKGCKLKRKAMRGMYAPVLKAQISVHSSQHGVDSPQLHSVLRSGLCNCPFQRECDAKLGM